MAKIPDYRIAFESDISRRSVEAEVKRMIRRLPAMAKIVSVSISPFNGLDMSFCILITYEMQ